MRPGTNRLLMLMIGAFVAGCASQTDRSSSGAGSEAQEAQVEYERVGGTSNVVTQEELERRAAAKAAAEAAAQTPPAEPAAPEYEPVQEDVQYIDSPLPETPAPAAAAAVAAAPEPAPEPEPAAAAPDPVQTTRDDTLPDFPVTKYEIEETDQQAAPEEPVEDLGPQADESGTASYAEEPRADAESGISEPTTYPDEPAPAVAAPVATSVSVNFEAEPLFSFDRAQIRKDQQQVIDDFVAGLNGVEYDEIAVVGHADRIGAEPYNQKLSERRANAVKAYLVSQGVPEDKINAEGRGESETVVGDSCQGNRGKVLISCLQPDRRVDITVNGSRNN